MLHWLSKRTCTINPIGFWWCYFWVDERHDWWEIVCQRDWRPIP